MNNIQALTTIVANPNIRLARTGWLAAHGKVILGYDEEGKEIAQHTRTSKAYQSTLDQFRDELARIGKDVDADVQTIMMVAQSFASKSKKKAKVSDSTQNTRLAILCSFFDYAIERFLLMPMDVAGHVLNPIKVIDRVDVEPYHNIKWLEEQEVSERLKQIDRSTPAGKRDFILLHILVITGRRAAEVASLQWKHVHQSGEIVTLTFEHCKGEKTMRDELEAPYSKALFTWLRAIYGDNLAALGPETPLWPAMSLNSKQRDKAISVRTIERIARQHLGVHTHITRHSFSHAMIKAGATLPELQDRLGHSSLHTTGIYAKVFTGAKNPHAKKLAAAFGID